MFIWSAGPISGLQKKSLMGTSSPLAVRPLTEDPRGARQEELPARNDQNEVYEGQPPI
jgi:hypothetical protein